MDQLKNSDIYLFNIVAGHVGLLAGERPVNAGSSADEICLVDVAGDSSGTWYWDRYPDL